MGSDGYIGKKRQWDAEDEQLARAGVENVWKKFPGRAESYIRARAKLSDPQSGELTYSSPRTQEVAQRVMAAASEGSQTGSRENELLTQALGNKEQRGRVCGVSAYTGWQAGFPDDKYSFRKRNKHAPPDHIDVVALRRDVAMDIISALKPILNEKGIDIPDDFQLPTRTPDRRSSYASVDQ